MIGGAKEKIKDEWVKPKDSLHEARLKSEYTAEYLAASIGVSKRQYLLKEKGAYPFKDYEMLIISKLLKRNIGNLFF